MIHGQAVATELMITPQLLTNADAPTARIDLKGVDYVVLSLQFSIELNTNAVGPGISLLSSDDTIVTNFATITADRATEDLTAAKIVEYRVDARNHKRYLRLVVTNEATTDGDHTLSVLAIKSRLDADPASTSDMGADVVVLV